MNREQADHPKTLPVQTLQKTVLSQEIYNELRTAILEGGIEPGTRFVEEPLARQMGVSRAPLREAIWRLERDGLLKQESARDTRVISLAEDDIRELHLIRTVMETVAFQHAANHISEDELVSLDELVERMKSTTDEEGFKLLAELDYQFHRRLCQAARLPRLYQIWYQQHILFRLWLNVVAKRHDNDIEEIAASHRAILSAVRARDNEQIAHQVHNHIYFIGSAMKAERNRWGEEQPLLILPSVGVARK